MSNKNRKFLGYKLPNRKLMALAACLTIWLSAAQALAQDGPRFYRNVNIKCFHSFYYQSDQPIKRVSVNEPIIANVKIISPFELMIDGKAPYSTVVTIWFEDESYGALNVRVFNPEMPPYGGIKGVEVLKGVTSDGQYVPVHRDDYYETETQDAERFVSE